MCLSRRFPSLAWRLASPFVTALSLCVALPAHAQTFTLDNNGNVVVTRPQTGSVTAVLSGTIINPADGETYSLFVPLPYRDQTGTSAPLSGQYTNALFDFYNAGGFGATFTGDLVTFAIDSTTALGTYQYNALGDPARFVIIWSNDTKVARNFSVTVVDGSVPAVPEPGEYAVMGMAGLTVCGLMIRTRRRKGSTGAAV